MNSILKSMTVFRILIILFFFLEHKDTQMHDVLLIKIGIGCESSCEVCWCCSRGYESLHVPSATISRRSPARTLNLLLEIF